jgi:hypothetical protein
MWCIKIWFSILGRKPAQTNNEKRANFVGDLRRQGAPRKRWGAAPVQHCSVCRVRLQLIQEAI